MLALIGSLLHLYVLWRVSSVPYVKRYISLKYLIIIGLGLWAVLFSGLFFGHDRTGIFASALESVAMTWMAVLFLVFICLLAADILTGFGFFMPRYAASMRGWALFAGALLSMTAFIQGYRAPVVERYEIQINDLPKELDGAAIIALSDLHLGSQLGDKWLASCVARVNEQKPDLIVLLGDIVEGHSRDNQDAFAAALARLSAPLGVWAVLGNHENFGNRDAGSITSIFEKAGIPVLRGNWKELKQGLILAGVDSSDRRMDRQKVIPNTITQALKGRPEGVAILLSHFPVGAEEAAKAGADLMLCGHTHGGQIWPFSYLVRLSYPLFAGKYEVAGMPVIVSRGAGIWGPRMRLWKPGEIIKVSLRAKDIQGR